MSPLIITAYLAVIGLLYLIFPFVYDSLLRRILRELKKQNQLLEWIADKKKQ